MLRNRSKMNNNVRSWNLESGLTLFMQSWSIPIRKTFKLTLDENDTNVIEI
jgi:hypothetical protein